MSRIIFPYTGRSMNDMTEEEQEAIWVLSRDNEVFEEDANGELWQVLDMTHLGGDDVVYAA